MTILTFLGTMDITDTDDYGTIQLKLAYDLHDAIRSGIDERSVEARARNIIKVCCESMLDNLIDVHNWSSAETAYADQVMAQCIETATLELLKIANRRMTHQRKRERKTGLCIEDLRISAIMAFVLTVTSAVIDQLEEAFLEDHGAMNFKS